MGLRSMPNKKNKVYERVGTLTVDNVLEHVGEKRHVFWIGNTPYTIKMRSMRYKVFKIKGVCCTKCGIVGTHFAIERSNGQTGGFHLNLYATKPDGTEVLMTRDHTIPRSKGGPNNLANQEPMCTYCNGKKGDNYE